MKKILIACLLIVSIAFKAQTKKPETPSKDLFSCWKASYEENNEKRKTQVFRSCSYTKFAPSMFRLEIEFFADGKCKYLHVGPTDNHYYVEGKWTYNKKTKKLNIEDDKGSIEYKFKFKEIKNDVLILVTQAK